MAGYVDVPLSDLEARYEHNQILANQRPKCGAPLVSGKGVCKHPAGYGTSHLGAGTCKFHAGNTPSHRLSAARELGRAFLDRDRMFGGHIRNITPEEALLEEVQRSSGMVQWLNGIIATWTYGNQTDKHELSDDDLGGLPHLGVVIEFEKGGTVASTERAAWLDLYRAERQHLARTSKMCIDAGLSDRIVKIAEQQGNQLADAIERVLEALQLTPQQASQVPQIVPQILKGMSLNAIEGTVVQSHVERGN